MLCAPGTHLTRAMTRVQREAGAAVLDEDAMLRKRLFEARRKAMQCSAVRNLPAPEAEPDAEGDVTAGADTTDTEAEGQAAPAA